MSAPQGTDLADFVLARIDDDQDQARYATAGPWQNVRINDSTDGWNVEARGTDGTHYDVAVDHANPADGACGGSDAAHIARWNPTRVLAECDAKRRIVEALRRAEEGDEFRTDIDGGALTSEQSVGYVVALRAVAGLLALPYASHRDYRKEWRP
jgi:hypothetical protein